LQNSPEQLSGLHSLESSSISNSSTRNQKDQFFSRSRRTRSSKKSSMIYWVKNSEKKFELSPLAYKDVSFLSGTRNLIYAITKTQRMFTFVFHFNESTGKFIFEISEEDFVGKFFLCHSSKNYNMFIGTKNGHQVFLQEKS
jgi:hypothetical protein